MCTCKALNIMEIYKIIQNYVRNSSKGTWHIKNIDKCNSRIQCFVQDPIFEKWIYFFFTIDRRIKEKQDRKASRQFSGQRFFFLYVDQ